MIPIDSIKVPGWVKQLCSEWYDGSGCMLYAVSSTGGLTCGSIRPRGADTPEKWYLSIWCDFSVDIGRAARTACDACRDGTDGGDDAGALEDAEAWVDAVCLVLAVDYGLEDWDGCDD